MGNTYTANVLLSCTRVDRSLFEIGCLGPSLLIILVLAFIKRRESSKLSCGNGYPGLVIPINFLRSSESNRFVIAAAFGATASACLDLALISDLNHVFPFPKEVDPWLKVFQGLLAVLMYAILFYPYFACLTTKHKLIGSLMGFLYTTIRFPLAIVLGLGLGSIFQCGSHHDIKDTLKNLRAIGQLPMLCCLLFIMVRFAVLLGIQVRKHWFSDSSCGTCRATVSELDEEILPNGSTEIEHVRRLLNLDQRKASSDVKGLRKLLYYIYQPRSDFKFSTQFLSTLLVAGIALFEIAVVLLIFIRISKQRCDSDKDCENFSNTVHGSIEASCVLCFLISALLLLHFMKCHRDHVFQRYRGERFCQDVAVSPTELVGQSLCFSGYQIAYAIIGYLIMFTPLLLISVSAGFIVLLKLDRMILAELQQFMLGTLPTLALGVVTFLFQLFLKSYVFRDRNFPNITITVANRQLFSIASYFFFFFNIIVGLISGVFRLFKGLLLGIVFMLRIDRTLLMKGYQTWDGAFLAYVGFLNVLVAHSHPVMLVFCHLLINRNSDRALEEPLEGTSSEATPLEAAVEHLEGIVRQRRVARFSQKAANRWLLAVMLLRNPSLRSYRRQGRVTSLLDMRSNRINSTVIIRI